MPGLDDGSVAERLQKLGVKGVLVRMAKNGQILQLRCEMPTCYSRRGRTHFEGWLDQADAETHKWCPNADHYPTLKKDHGKLTPSNVRLAHVYCNNLDYGWRTRIRAMLEKDQSLSFAEIAKALNKKKTVLLPPNADK